MINENAMIKKPSNDYGSDVRPKSFISKYYINKAALCCCKQSQIP